MVFDIGECNEISHKIQFLMIAYQIEDIFILKIIMFHNSLKNCNWFTVNGKIKYLKLKIMQSADLSGKAHITEITILIFNIKENAMKFGTKFDFSWLNVKC